MSGGTPRPVDELTAAAGEIMAAVARSGASLRLMGGVAIRWRTVEFGGLAPQRRAYHDLDLVGRLRDVRVIDATITGLGYEPDRAINAQFGTVRRVYYHPSGFHVDLFFERLEFCHTIELAERLDRVPHTLSPSDLLLQKLQIVERNEKDLIDVFWLLLNHDLGVGDPAQLELDYLARLAGTDWGLYTTATDFLVQANEHLTVAGVRPEMEDRLRERIGQLLAHLEQAPKSARWRARDLVGRRVRWYRTVEEVL